MKNKLYALGALEVLFLIFLVLKLAGIVDWGWLSVCAPLILDIIFAIITIILSER